MAKVRKKISFIILTFIFTSFITFSIFGFGFIGNNYEDLNLKPESNNFNQLSSSIREQVNSNNQYLDSQIDNENSVFNYLLKETLLDLYSIHQNAPKKVKIIILFKDQINKEKRIDIISSAFQDYNIITNYEIIPGTYIKVNAAELIAKESLLGKIEDIKMIYQSEKYESPYILPDSLQLGALNKDSYSNWWLPAISASNLPFNGAGIKVAVIDTGIYGHPALNIIANQNFVSNESSSNFNDDVGHGTHVAGIIGGDGSGSQGLYQGVAPGVSLINARAGNASGLLDTDIISAIEWSSKPVGLGGAGADIVSMSFGGGRPYISDLITQAITNAKESYGVIFVASAGNSGPDYFTGSSPASGIDVIAVGASDRNNRLASFSSWGPTFRNLEYPDIVAPGVNIISTEAQGSIISKEERLIGNFFDFTGDADYIPLSGTSMSAPVVAGTLAILKEAYPNITPETARIALLEGATKLSNNEDDDILRSGAGLINVSASLDYLNSISPDHNNTAAVYPDNLPIIPFDLLNFPGDRQKFNLTIISGKNNMIEIGIPNNIQDLTISSDKSAINFTDSGIGFIELEIEINKDAVPGLRNFQLNLTVEGQIYDIVDVQIEIKLPEARILMESYHGLNDWFPEFSFYQMGFYEAMKDIVNLDISIDYGMEYWTPDYNKNIDNSILTEERLSMYDLVVLQNPVLPYSPLEIDNLKNFFDNGGSLLFLGTRYQDMVVDNVNYLFSELGVGIQINEENIMNDNWLGVRTRVSSQDVQNFDNSIIFQNVNSFLWEYGNSFTTTGNAETIATVNDKTVVAMYNSTQEEKGRFLAFGDLHWTFSEYEAAGYKQEHSKLLKNVINFLLPNDDASINIDVGSERSSNGQINLSLFLKDQLSETPISTLDYDSLEVNIENGPFEETLSLNETLSSFGIYFNNSYTLPTPSYIPYTVKINLTIS
ncbi:MAG: S8 family peptidase, partial [Promethearchaeota archaeon]